MRTVLVALCGVLARTRVISLARVEFVTMTVDAASPFNGDVVGVDRVKQHDISVGRRNAFPGGIMIGIAAAQQAAGGGNVQCDVALQFHGADNKVTGWDQDSATFILGAGVDGGLNGGGVKGCAIALGAVFANVVGAGAGSGARSGSRGGELRGRKRDGGGGNSTRKVPPRYGNGHSGAPSSL